MITIDLKGQPKEFEAGVTYVELMEQNIEHLRKGLDE